MKRRVLERFEAVDLTHSLNEGVPTWSGGCGFQLKIKMDYEEGLRVQKLQCHAGIGTHLDAPSHFIRGSWTAADLPLESLIVPAVVIDLKEKADPDFLLSREDIERFEALYGTIPEESLVLLHTGWDRFWNEPLRYRNPDSSGKMHFPGFSR